MTKTTIIAAALLAISPAAVAAQTIDENLAAIAEDISAEVEAEVKEAMKPENVERQRSADQLIVDNAMRQIALSNDPGLANKLPLPEYSGLDAMTAALRHPNAWEKYSKSHHDNEELIEAMTGISMTTGTLLYYEWGCDTGRMKAVAGQYIDIVDNLVTAYPERIMLQNAIGIRNMMGYPQSKSCNREILTRDRADFQAGLSAILEASASSSAD